MKSLLNPAAKIVEIKFPLITGIPSLFVQCKEEINYIINDVKKEDYLNSYPYFTFLNNNTSLGYKYSNIKEKREIIGLIFSAYYEEFGKFKVQNFSECYNTIFIDWLYQKDKQ